MSTQPLCWAPWTNLDIDPGGNISPCCKFQQRLYPDRFNIQHHDIAAYRGSRFLQEIKQQLQQQQWPSGCERCRIEEENHIPSKRVLDQERWYELYEQYDINSQDVLTASVAFGNTCNLKCITCGPQSSSLWQQEYREIYGIEHRAHRFLSERFAQDFEQHTGALRHIDIPGGEPFISGVRYQQDLLDRYIKKGLASRISLHYTTNATIYPDDSWWSRWQQFQEIDLQLSIDAVGEKFEYIRFPAKWHQVLGNVDRYQQQVTQVPGARLSISHTVSAYNILYLDQFYGWCVDQGLPEPWLGRVHAPEHLRPSVWPEPVKQLIQDRLSQSRFPAVQHWAGLINNSDDSEHFELFRHRTRQHDAYRHLSFAETFPELASHI